MRSSARTNGSLVLGALLGVKQVVAVGRPAGTVAFFPFFDVGWLDLVLGAVVELLGFPALDSPVDILGCLEGAFVPVDAACFALLFFFAIFFLFLHSRIVACGAKKSVLQAITMTRDTA